MSGLIFYPGIVHPVVVPISDGINPVSTTISTQWHVSQRLSPTVVIEWDIIAYGISASVEVRYDVLARVQKVGGFIAYGITKPAVWPVDYKELIPQSAWDIYDRSSVEHKSEWNIRQRRSSSRSAKWNVRYSEYATENLKWDVLKRVHKPGLGIDYWTNQVDVPLVHPVAYENYSIDPPIQWNMNQRLGIQEDIRWDVRVPVKALRALAWNTKILSVTKQISIEWDLRKEVSSEVKASWNLIQRRFARKAVSWHTNYSLVIDKSVRWHTLNNVTIHKAVAWELQTSVVKQLPSRWRVHSPVKARVSSRWDIYFREHLINWHLVFNSPGNICTSVVRPVDKSTPALQPLPVKALPEPVVQPLDGNLYGGYGQSPQPGIAWRVPVDPVTKQDSVEWNVYYRVPVRAKTDWNLSKRTAVQKQSLYNVYYKVTNSLSSAWIVGGWVPSHIRQTAQVRTDFAY
jgi:hypothetical protein